MRGTNVTNETVVALTGQTLPSTPIGGKPETITEPMAVAAVCSEGGVEIGRAKVSLRPSEPVSPSKPS